MALGAARRQVAWLVLAQALRLVGQGLVVGLVAAPLAGVSLRAMLYEVSPRDLAVLASVTVALLAVGAAASLVPALRAARLDPMTALREE
jgi:ABC-type antimicrobial peptide transport system permease subunit